MDARILMAEKESSAKGITPDWLVHGVLTKIGDIVDRLTGRGWKPSSGLATSELIERLKVLLDSEAQDESPGCKFVPNNIKLKMQWDKFSDDSEEGMRKLEIELLAAAVDHINDKRYYTHAPLSVSVKPDYFTPGVRLTVTFNKAENDENEAAVDLSIPGSESGHIDESVPPHKIHKTYVAVFVAGGEEHRRSLELERGLRLSVGRTKENDLSIDDQSVSKIHASLTVDDMGNLIVADTGSTNGTFINGERIPYGKAVFVGNGGRVKFGSVEVTFTAQNIPKPYDLVSAHPSEAQLEKHGGDDEREDAQELSGLLPTEPAFTLSSIANESKEDGSE